MSEKEPIPDSLADLTAARLTEILRSERILEEGCVTEIRTEPIGEESGFSGQLARLELEYADPLDRGPGSLIAKLPSRDPRMRALVQLFGGYEREHLFFTRLAHRCALPLARCYRAMSDREPTAPLSSPDRKRAARIPGWLRPSVFRLALWLHARRKQRYLLLLEDLGDLRPGDQIRGADGIDAAAAAAGLAALHGSFWNDPELAVCGWLPDPLAGANSKRADHRRHSRRFLRDLSVEPPPHFASLMSWADRMLERILDRLREAPSTLLHGDFRLDNLFFKGEEIRAIDWQGVSRGPGVLDWAGFTGGSLRRDVTEDQELSLLEIYHRTLVLRGVRDYSFQRCRRDYALAKILVAYTRAGAPPNFDGTGERFDELRSRWHRRLVSRLPPSDWDDLLANSDGSARGELPAARVG